MGIFDRILGKRKERADRGRYDEGFEDLPPEGPRDDLLIDHEFVFEPESDYDRNLGSMAYKVRIENTGTYPMGSPTVEFIGRTRLGRFGKHEPLKGMVEPGSAVEVVVPFKPGYTGGKEELEFQIGFFDFRTRSQERISLKTEPFKVTVPKFKPLEKDNEGYRVLTSNLYRWTLETEIIDIAPKTLFGSVTDHLREIGFHESNEMVNEGMFRGIRQFCATDEKGRKWAAQVQVIGKGKESKMLMYTFGERPQYAYNLSTRVLLKLPERDKLLSHVIAGEA